VAAAGSECPPPTNILTFENAAISRDPIKELKRTLDGSPPAKDTKAHPVSYRKTRNTCGVPGKPPGVLARALEP